jgi:allantoinase
MVRKTYLGNSEMRFLESIVRGGDYSLVIVDLVIKNGKIVTSHDIFEAGIGVDEGKIVAVAKDTNLPKADITLDMNGKFILPGPIDAHVHFRDPGSEHREDFETGTKAAAAGGVTTVFEMPISTPAVSSADILERRRNIVKKKAVVDFALYGGAGTHNIDNIPSIADAGAIGFKTFLTKPLKEREKEYEGIFVTDDGSLFHLLEMVAQTKLPCSIHSENYAVINHLTKRLRKAGRKDPMAHIESRPSFVEAEAISRVITFAEATGARVHIAHMSTKEGVQLVKSAKASGKAITAETCPQYLTLTSELMKKMGPYAKINPPLRYKKDIEALLTGLNNGTVDIVASDHAPYTKEEKDVGWDNIWRAFAGAPQLETMLSLLLTKVNEGKLSLRKLTKIVSESVAKIFAVYPKKGVIQVGSDADFIVVDLKKEQKISTEKMYSKAKDITLYDGWKVKGVPTMTIVRGTLVMKDGEVIGKPGYGNFTTPLKNVSLE